MRLSMSRALTIICLAVSVFSSPSASSASARGSRSSLASQSKTVLVATWEETGLGTSVSEARQNALEKARSGIVDWLEKHRPDITWIPSETYLESLALQVGEPQTKDLPVSGPMEEVRVKIELTTDNLREMEQMSRQELARHRQEILARGLAGTVVLLVIAAAYLRVTEKASGRYKYMPGLLIAGMIGLLFLQISFFGERTMTITTNAETVFLIFVFVNLLACPITGGLAVRKGYNFFLWVFAGGLFGLIVMAILPAVTVGQTFEEKAGRRRTGNWIGTGISLLAITFAICGGATIFLYISPADRVYEMDHIREIKPVERR